MIEPRFRVLTVTGFPIHPKGGRGGDRSYGAPGLSATVFDSAYEREVATYRSEEQRALTAARKRELAIERAERHAAILNRELGS